MEHLTIALIILGLIFNSITEALQVKWGLIYNKTSNEAKRLSQSWHMSGFMYRACYALAVVPISVAWFGVAIIMAWHVYDIAINTALGQKWNYEGETANIDRMGWVVWAGKILVIIATAGAFVFSF